MIVSNIARRRRIKRCRDCFPFFTADYNLAREHQAIKKTPVKAAGFNLKLGHDKWNGLIKKAYKHKQTGGKIMVWEK